LKGGRAAVQFDTAPYYQINRDSRRAGKKWTGKSSEKKLLYDFDSSNDAKAYMSRFLSCLNSKLVDQISFHCVEVEKEKKNENLSR